MLWRRKIEKKTATKWWCWWNRQKIVQQESCKTTIRDLVKKIENVCRMHFRLWQFQVNIKPTRRKQNQKKSKEFTQRQRKRQQQPKIIKRKRHEQRNSDAKPNRNLYSWQSNVWWCEVERVRRFCNEPNDIFSFFFFFAVFTAHKMQNLTI